MNAPLRKLEKIVAALEATQRPLDEAMPLSSVELLASHCAALLEQAGFKVRRLSGDELLEMVDGERMTWAACLQTAS